MKILVCIKRVIDYAVHIRVKSDGTGVDMNNVKMSINPFDLIALEEAVRLKENHHAKEVIVISVGNDDSQESLRQCLALGADRAILVKVGKTYEPLNIAKIIRQVIKLETFDLVLLGKQAIDDDCNQTGQMLAGLLNWPQGTFASKITMETPKEIFVTREIDGGLETLKLTLPAIVTTDLRLNIPRYASLPNIMKAKQKNLDIMTLDKLGIEETDLSAHTEILETFLPPKRKSGVILDNVDELINHLKLKQVLI